MPTYYQCINCKEYKKILFKNGDIEPFNAPNKECNHCNRDFRIHWDIKSDDDAKRRGFSVVPINHIKMGEKRKRSDDYTEELSGKPPLKKRKCGNGDGEYQSQNSSRKNPQLIKQCQSHRRTLSRQQQLFKSPVKPQQQSTNRLAQRVIPPPAGPEYWQLVKKIRRQRKGRIDYQNYYRCAYCEDLNTGVERIALKRHRENKNEDQVCRLSKENKKLFKCYFCSKGYDDFREMRKHIEECVQKKRFRKKKNTQQTPQAAGQSNNAGAILAPTPTPAPLRIDQKAFVQWKPPFPSVSQQQQAQHQEHRLREQRNLDSDSRGRNNPEISNVLQLKGQFERAQAHNNYDECLKVYNLLPQEERAKLIFWPGTLNYYLSSYQPQPQQNAPEKHQQIEWWLEQFTKLKDDKERINEFMNNSRENLLGFLLYMGKFPHHKRAFYIAWFVLKTFHPNYLLQQLPKILESLEPQPQVNVRHFLLDELPSVANLAMKKQNGPRPKTLETYSTLLQQQRREWERKAQQRNQPIPPPPQQQPQHTPHRAQWFLEGLIKCNHQEKEKLLNKQNDEYLRKFLKGLKKYTSNDYRYTTIRIIIEIIDKLLQARSKK